MPNPWDDRYRIRNLETIAGLQPGDKLDVTGTNEFKRQRRGAWTSIARTFSRNKSSAYYAPIYKVFQETIISGFIFSNGTGAGINWNLIERSLNGLRNLARTYENDRGKRDRLNRLVTHVETLCGLQPSDGLPLHIVSRHRSVLRVEPNPHETAKLLALKDFKNPVEHGGFSVDGSFFKDVLDHAGRSCPCMLDNESIPKGEDGIDFLAKKFGNDRSALRDLSRGMNQNAWGDLGLNLSSYSTCDNSKILQYRPMFAAPNGYGIMTVVGGEDANWNSHFAIRRRMQGGLVEALEITFTSYWRPLQVWYYDFAINKLVGTRALPSATRSPVQSLELDVKVSLRRAGESFVPMLHSALFTVYTRPFVREDDGTPEWMLESEDVQA